MTAIGGFFHPFFAGGVIALGFVVLVMGLKIRRARASGQGGNVVRLAALHLRLGKWFTILFPLAYLLGLGAMHFILEEPLYQSAHSYFGTISLILVLGSAFLGRRLRKRPGDEDARQLHSYCAFLALFVSLAVVFLGYSLLP